MSRLQVFSFKACLLAVASLMLASGAVLAHGGGGHGGGGHGGGGHGGHGGIGHVGGIGHIGGFNRGIGLGGFNRGFGFSGFSRGLGYGNGLLFGRGYNLGLFGLGGLGYGLGYGGFGLGYGGYGYPFSNYGSSFGYPYVNGYPYTNSGFSNGYPGGGYLYGAPGITGYSSSYTPQQQAQAPAKDDAAHLLVIVPENAELWFNGAKTSRTGPQREFVSPPLTPGKSYTYEVKARWMQDGKPVEQTRNVHVQANSWQQVDLTRPEKPAAPEK
ncbi:MAG TPA: TIGR03000 domain-containing protein [Gemmataceae bacterium]